MSSISTGIVTYIPCRISTLSSFNFFQLQHWILFFSFHHRTKLAMDHSHHMHSMEGHEGHGGGGMDDMCSMSVRISSSYFLLMSAILFFVQQA